MLTSSPSLLSLCPCCGCDLCSNVFSKKRELSQSLCLRNRIGVTLACGLGSLSDLIRWC